MNANVGTPHGPDALATVIGELGVGRGVVADADGVLIGGNKTVEAARKAGITKVVVVETDGDTLLVNKRRDVRLADKDDHRGRALALADNGIQRQTQKIDLQIVHDQINSFVIPPELVGYKADDFAKFQMPEIGQPESQPFSPSGETPSSGETSAPSSTESEGEGEPDPIEINDPMRTIYQIVVDCRDEDDQRRLFDELTAAGRRCRPQQL